MKKLLFILSVLSISLITSCSDVAEIKENLIIEQVKVVGEGETDCNSNQIEFKYRVKLKSSSGDVYYYSDYKYEVGDTLVSFFEFDDSKEYRIKLTQAKLDSVIELQANYQKKIDELELYNSLLTKIIKENVTK